MTEIPPKLLSAARAAYENRSHLFLLFDYDGTLVPIVDHPHLAQLSGQTRATLERLASLPEVHLGVLSGRRHSELKEMLGIPGIFLAGTAGLELDFRGIVVKHPNVGDSVGRLQDVATKLRQLTSRFRGAWIEQKPLGLTLHFRDVALRDVGELSRLARAIVSEDVDRLRVVDGPMAVEITPDLGWTKGTAVRMFLGNLPVRSRFILYAGDGPNDVEAIEAVNDLGGITIGVGTNAPPGVEFRIPSSRVLCSWLHRLRLTLLRVAIIRSCSEPMTSLAP